jgi:hypothetical protein
MPLEAAIAESRRTPELAAVLHLISMCPLLGAGRVPSSVCRKDRVPQLVAHPLWAPVEVQAEDVGE